METLAIIEKLMQEFQRMDTIATFTLNEMEKITNSLTNRRRPFENVQK